MELEQIIALSIATPMIIMVVIGLIEKAVCRAIRSAIIGLSVSIRVQQTDSETCLDMTVHE
jgi:hypothetical protein